MGLITGIDKARYRRATWAIPLWSERGLSGMLLLGPKAGDGFYMREEIEIARAAGERLIDTAAKEIHVFARAHLCLHDNGHSFLLLRRRLPCRA